MYPQVPCFLSHTYKDWQLGIRLIGQIRSFYPSARIICISDGYGTPELERYCQAKRVNHIRGERLYLRKFGGAYVERMLSIFITHATADCLIWLDADSYMLRPFHTLPQSDIAGNMIPLQRDKKLIQGGCIYLSQQACRRILKSKILQDPFFSSDMRFFYRHYALDCNLPIKAQKTEVFASSDAVITYVAEQLSLQFEEWGEACNYYDKNQHNLDNYAVIHPVKQLTLP